MEKKQRERKDFFLAKPVSVQLARKLTIQTSALKPTYHITGYPDQVPIKLQETVITPLIQKNQGRSVLVPKQIMLP